MKAWQIKAPNIIEETTRQDNLESVSSSKIKITKALISDNDAFAFIGNDDSKYPVIPGRNAVGIITETGSNCFGIEKNDRVYINPVSNCGECYNCKSGNKNTCIDVQIAGENSEGFLRDFAVLPCSELFNLPDSVTDDNALFIEHIALSIAIIDKLNITKGDHVAVIGASTLGNLLCQLIIYYQGVPILIDKDEANLEVAIKSGIYYTLKNDSSIIKNVSDLTGGRMTEKCVYITDCTLNTKLALNLTSYSGSVAFAGFNAHKINIDFATAMKKQLTVVGITDGYGQTAAAINILVNKALNFSAFSFATIGYNAIPKTISEKANQIQSGAKTTETIVKLL
jgi:L-gulonate 5-dehydrogenase